MPDLNIRASTPKQPTLNIQTSTNTSPSSFPPAPPFLHAHYPATYSPHADDTFYSGAWLFEPDLAPQWLMDAFPVTPMSAAMQRKQAKRYYQQHQPLLHQKEKQQLSLASNPPTTKSLLTTWEETLRTGRWLFEPNSAPAWLRPHISTSSPGVAPSKATSSSMEAVQEIRRAAHRATEDPLVTGVWLFHPEEAPVWLARQLQESTPSTAITSMPKKKKRQNLKKQN